MLALFCATISRMATVIKLFWNICLLRVGPELVPARAWFVCPIIAAHVAINVLWLDVAVPGMSFALALNAALINLAVMAAASWFALYIRQHEGRFPATLGAAAGAETFLMAVLLVAYGLTSGVVRQTVVWGFVLWSVVVVGFILHRALSCKPWLGMLLSLAILFASAVVVQAVLTPMLPTEALLLDQAADQAGDNAPLPQ